jgi:hypothetical protein
MAGTWQPLAHQPSFAASTMLLLTDGTVMCQDGGGKNWWRLTPDSTGDYVNGTWSPLTPMNHSRLYYASAVLRDGRVFFAGGEYSDAGSETTAAEIFDPVIDYWRDIPSPAGWSAVGDAPCCVLPDGRVLVGSIETTETAIFDPVSETWTAAAAKDDRSSEETWVLLQDETVLAVECTNHPKAEKYVAPADRWVSAGSLSAEVVQASSIEIGPGMLLPDGRAFFAGATGHTALYTPPPLASQAGTWLAGPDFPAGSDGNLLEAKDAPGCLMPNGKVLLVASPAGEGGTYPSPTSFFEFDGAAINPVPSPANNGGPCFTGRMLVVPTGQVLFAAGTSHVEAYTPDGAPDSAWAPQITFCPTQLQAKQTFTLQGRQLNGVSQACSYGDDAGLATNYPIVRIRNLQSGHVRYCRTFNHSTMAVATGNTIHHTSVKIPAGMETGSSELCVITNGICSNCVTVMVNPFRLHFSVDEAMVNRLIGSLADGPLWVLGPNGPVPVDPWGPRVKAEAKKANRALVAAVKDLQRLGREVEKLRAGHERFATEIGPSHKTPAKKGGRRRRGGGAE